MLLSSGTRKILTNKPTIAQGLIRALSKLMIQPKLTRCLSLSQDEHRAESLRNRKDTDASLSTALSSVVTVTEVRHGFSPIPLSFLHPFSCQISPTPSF
jgi:hypothetical protein